MILKAVRANSKLRTNAILGSYCTSRGQGQPKECLFLWRYYSTVPRYYSTVLKVSLVVHIKTTADPFQSHDVATESWNRQGQGKLMFLNKCIRQKIDALTLFNINQCTEFNWIEDKVYVRTKWGGRAYSFTITHHQRVINLLHFYRLFDDKTSNTVAEIQISSKIVFPAVETH